MFAVIRTGGKQYRVTPDAILTVERLAGEPGGAVAFEDIVMVAAGTDIAVGADSTRGALVRAEILEHKRGDKILILKKKRRKNYRRRGGHRQRQTVVKITEIVAAASESQGLGGTEHGA